MRIVWIGLASLVGLAVLFFGFIYAASELGGEIVTLETSDAAGKPHETRLWVVDDDGDAWLRSGMPTSTWYAQLVANPAVRVTRNGETHAYRAEPDHDPVVRDRIHAKMAEKYGASERIIASIRDGSQSVPVRLVPVPSQ